MASNPGGKSDDGGPDGSEIEARKTRFVPRSDVVDRSAPAKVEAPGKVEAPVKVEAPGNPAGTVIGRTRLMGDHGQSAQGSGVQPAMPIMPMGQAKTEFLRAETFEIEPVAGWVVVEKGPGRGNFRPIFAGMNSVGRDPSQRVSLGFGDESISREEHAFITYDEEQRCFWLQHGGKSNLVRLGSTPVLAPMPLKANDSIRIGRTTLRFVPCCGPDFSWSDEIEDA